MKTLITATLFMLFSTIVSAQDFSLSTFAGNGIKFDKSNNATLYQASLSVIPQFNFNKLSVEGISKSILIDSTTEFQAGMRFSYNVWNDENNKSLWLSTHYLYGSDKAQIVGAGVGYDVNLLRMNFEGGYDLQTDNKYLEFNIGLRISE